MQQPDYMIEYERFIADYATKGATANDIAVVWGRMVAFYVRYQHQLKDALQSYSIKAKMIYETVDPGTGKPITAAKGEVIAAATPEAATYESAKSHVQGLEQIILAMRSMHQGALPLPVT